MNVYNKAQEVIYRLLSCLRAYFLSSYLSYSLSHFNPYATHNNRTPPASILKHSNSLDQDLNGIRGGSNKKVKQKKNVEQKKHGADKNETDFFVFHGKSTFLEFSSMDIHFLEFQFHEMSPKPVKLRLNSRKERFL